MTTEFGAITDLTRQKDVAEPQQLADKISPTTVKAMMRKQQIQKAIPEWSIPTAAWLIAENEIATVMAEIWNEIGTENKIPDMWEKCKQYG